MQPKLHTQDFGVVFLGFEEATSKMSIDTAYHWATHFSPCWEVVLISAGGPAVVIPLVW